MGAIEKKTKPFSFYASEALAKLREKYKVEDKDMRELERALDWSFREWAIHDVLEDAVKLTAIKKEVEGRITVDDLAGVIAECQRLVGRMLKFQTEFVPLMKISALVNGEGAFQKGDEKAPFFSEGFLYNLLGKEDARSVLYPMQELTRTLGLRD